MGAVPERFGITISELQLDVLAVRFDGFATDPKFTPNLSDAMSGGDQREDMQLTI